MRAPSILCLLFSLLFVAACFSEGVRRDDLPLLVTIEDLQPYGFDFSALKQHETISRNRYFDRSLEVVYEFESPESHPQTLYLSVTVNFERNAREATSSYRLESGFLTMGAKIGGAEIEGVPNFFEWGDESFFGNIVADGQVGGNIFRARKGRKLYLIIIAGIYFDNPEDWAELVSPKLRYLEGYEP